MASCNRSRAGLRRYRRVVPRPEPDMVRPRYSTGDQSSWPVSSSPSFPRIPAPGGPVSMARSPGSPRSLPRSLAHPSLIHLLPSPPARPIKSLLTVYSSGCAAFGHSGRLAQGPLPDKRREGTWRVKRFATFRTAAVLAGHQADVLVDDNRCCVRQMPPATAWRLMLSGSLSRVEDRQPKEPAAAPSKRCRPSRAGRSCCDRASRA
jgi:hypothetical protein